MDGLLVADKHTEHISQNKIFIMSFLKNIIKPVIPSKFWNDLRKKQILSKHKKVADLWNPIINDYLSGKLEKYPLRAKRTFPTSKIIWQYWGQGLDANNMPEIVHICFDSVDRYNISICPTLFGKDERINSLHGHFSPTCSVSPC